jgi:hypothetical protein
MICYLDLVLVHGLLEHEYLLMATHLHFTASTLIIKVLIKR